MHIFKYFIAFQPYYFIMSGKWKNEVLMLVMKCRSHKPNIIETKMEIIRHAEHEEYLASINCTLDVVSQLCVQS